MTITNSPLVAQPIKMQDLRYSTTWMILKSCSPFLVENELAIEENSSPLRMSSHFVVFGQVLRKGTFPFDVNFKLVS